MSRWNDTEQPIAYLITFRTYGTWLHGDERGSVDKHNNNFGGPRVETNIIREQQEAKRLKGEPVLLDAKRRSAVENAIREVCDFRKWTLYALNVRINHTHAVVSAESSSDKILNDLKAYATRKMRADLLWAYGHSPWVDRGSKRNLWNADHIFHACEYVVNGQGAELPRFD